MTLATPGDGLTPGRLVGRHPLGMVSLRVFEALHAGHALARHLHDGHGDFVSDAQRLTVNPGIPASGGFLDEARAQASVDAAVARNQARILAWRGAADRFHPFIAEIDLGWPNGSNLSREQFERGVVESSPTSGVRVVLMPDGRFASGFAVLTAYNVTVPRSDPAPLAVDPGTAFLAALPERAAAEAALAAGVQVAACWESAGRAREAVARGVAHWSADIRDWLADPGAPATLTRAFCDRATVGGTLHDEEWAAGERRFTMTPVVMFTVIKEAAAPAGFVVAAAWPSRGF